MIIYLIESDSGSPLRTSNLLSEFGCSNIHVANVLTLWTLASSWTFVSIIALNICFRVNPISRRGDAIGGGCDKFEEIPSLVSWHSEPVGRMLHDTELRLAPAEKNCYIKIN